MVAPTSARKRPRTDYTSFCTSTRVIVALASLVAAGITVLPHNQPQRPVSSSCNATDQRQAEFLSLLGCDRVDSGASVACAEAKLDTVESKGRVDAILLDISYQQALDRNRSNPYDNLTDPLWNQHAGLIPLAEEYTPKPEWKEGYANLNIIGMPKAGTTQLYNILTHHPDAMALNDELKEYCLIEPNADELWKANTTELTQEKLDTQRRLYNWHEKLYLDKQNMPRNLQTVNGCINMDDWLLHLFYLPPDPSNTKFLYLFRDPADLLWASFNFWAVTGLDTVQSDRWNTWLDVENHYRSPELFHELVVAGRLFFLIELRQRSVTNTRRLLHLVGRENVLLLRNEDLQPQVVDRSGGLLDQVASFTGLDRDRFASSTVHSFSNCNDAKGFSDCGNQTSSRYEIAGHRGMLEETRQYIYLQFYEECQIWRDEFGIEYPNCLNVLNTLDE